MLDSDIPLDWRKKLGEELNQTLKELQSFLKKELNSGKKIFPPPEKTFQALNLTALDQVKVVILGQDPYHGPGQAHGLSFSVPDGVPFPPSLRNIYKELASDIGVPNPSSGNLSSWAKQGVLLLNAVLSVESGLAGSHAGKGWETFTDGIIKVINENRDGVVFILWGNYALKKKLLINTDKHYVITSVHPSPLSASRGFFGSKPFSKANAYLEKMGQTPIDWRVN